METSGASGGSPGTEPGAGGGGRPGPGPQSRQRPLPAADGARAQAQAGAGRSQHPGLPRKIRSAPRRRQKGPATTLRTLGRPGDAVSPAHRLPKFPAAAPGKPRAPVSPMGRGPRSLSLSVPGPAPATVPGHRHGRDSGPRRRGPLMADSSHGAGAGGGGSIFFCSSGHTLDLHLRVLTSTCFDGSALLPLPPPPRTWVPAFCRSEFGSG